MSTVEYTRCDGCGRLSPVDSDPCPRHETGWARLSVWGGADHDLCPDCARRALAAAGIGGADDGRR